MTGARALAVQALGMLLPFALAAQAPRDTIPRLEPGLRVRIATGPNRIVGTLMSRTADTLTIATNTRTWHNVSARGITRLEVSEGESRAQGALRGFAIAGVGLGLLTLVVASPKAEDLENTVASVAIPFGVVGTVIGFVLRSESWVRVFPKPSKGERLFQPRSPYGTD